MKIDAADVVVVVVKGFLAFVIVKVKLVPDAIIEFVFIVIYCPLIEHVSVESEGEEQVAELNEISVGRV